MKDRRQKAEAETLLFFAHQLQRAVGDMPKKCPCVGSRRWFLREFSVRMGTLKKSKGQSVAWAEIARGDGTNVRVAANRHALAGVHPAGYDLMFNFIPWKYLHAARDFGCGAERSRCAGAHF